MAGIRTLPMPRLLLGAVLLTLVSSVFAVTVATRVVAQEHDETDPFRNEPLACEFVSSTQVPRAAKNIEHVANVCEIVGTDVEFQSRETEDGVFDYAFVGTMGFGFQIFDITDPENPTEAGGYLDPGWQNDVQVRGDIVVTTFDGVSGEPSTGSTCLKLNYPTSGDQGVDIFQLTYNGPTASPDFTVNLLGCVANPPGGAHNSTLHPSGEWLMIANSSSDWAVDFIDLRPLFEDEDPETDAVHRWRLIDESRFGTTGTTAGGLFSHERCPEDADFTCVVVTRPDDPALGSDPETVPCNPSPCPEESPFGEDSAWGLFRPHDIFFSRFEDPDVLRTNDGVGSTTMYVAALNSTMIIDISPLLAEANGAQPNLVSEPPNLPATSIIPNFVCPVDVYNVPGAGGCSDEETEGLNNPHNLQLSHQADTTADGAILVISDERGGGLQETRCNTDEAGVIGALHFWALAPIDGVPATENATEANPVRIGAYFNPNPFLGTDPQQENVEDLPRAERACTSHVFRIGGNGTMSPGTGGNLDGVSDLPPRQLTLGWYGAGIWWIEFDGPPDPEDDILEEPRTTWGNTLGWVVMPGSEAWSGKTYKAIEPAGDVTAQQEEGPTMYIYAGDMVRGFDVYRFTPGFAVEPTPIPTVTPTPTEAPTVAPTGTGAPTVSPGETAPPPGATTRPPARGRIPDTASGPGVAVTIASAVVLLVSLGALAAAARARRGRMT